MAKWQDAPVLEPVTPATTWRDAPVIGPLAPQPRPSFDESAVDKPGDILSLYRRSNTLGIGEVAQIYDPTDPLLPSLAWKPVADQIVSSLQETPENLRIGGIGLSASVLEAFERRGKQMQSDFMAEAEPGDEKARAVQERLLMLGSILPTTAPGEGPSVGAVAPSAEGPRPEQLFSAAGEYLRRRQQARETKQDQLTIRYAPITKIARDVVQGGIPSATTALGVSVLTRSPMIGLAILGETTGGQEWKEQMKAGASPLKAEILASLAEGAEIGGEMLVFPTFIKGLTKGIPITDAVTVIGENYGQEFATGFAQGWLNEFGKLTSQGVPTAQAAQQALDPAWEDAKQSGIVGGATAGLIDVATLPAWIQTRYSERQALQQGQPTTIGEIATQTTANLPMATEGEIKEAVNVPEEPAVQPEGGPAAAAPAMAPGPAATEARTAEPATAEAKALFERAGAEEFTPATEVEAQVKEGIERGAIETPADVQTVIEQAEPEEKRPLGKTAARQNAAVPAARILEKMMRPAEAAPEAGEADELVTWIGDGPGLDFAGHFDKDTGNFIFAKDYVAKHGRKPKVFYRGTDKAYPTLRPSEGGAAGPGIYLAENEKKAKAFAGKTGVVQKYYINVKNPLFIRAEDRHKAPQLNEYARANGYDSLYIASEGEWVIFDSVNIRTKPAEVPPAPTTTPEAKAAVVAAPKAGIEPWEMTSVEYGEQQAGKGSYQIRRWQNVHAGYVERAIREGKPIPIAVLEEYKGEPWADAALAKLGQTPAEAGVVEKRGEIPERTWYDIRAGEKASDIAAKLKPGEEVYVIPQWTISKGKKSELVRSGDYLRRAGLEPGSEVNRWRRLSPAPSAADQEWQTSIGAAAMNFESYRNAIKKAQATSTKLNQPMYVVQRTDGSFAAYPKPPKTGHYTLVDMKRPLVEQVTFIKQASPTVEEAFDYGEHPVESKKGLTDLQRFKQRLATKEADTESIKAEMYDYIKANVPPAMQGKFIPLLNQITPGRQTKTNLKDLVRAITRTEELLKGLDKKQAIRDLKNTWSEIRSTYRRGEVALGKLDQATREKLQAVMEKIDLQKISEAKKEQLASLSKYLNQLADEVGRGLRTMTEAEDAVLRISKGRIDALARLSKTPIAEMEAEDIREITQSLIQLVHGYELKNELLGKRRSRQMQAVKKDAIGEIYNRQPETTADLTQKRGGRGILSPVRQVFSTRSAHLRTLVQWLTKAGAKVTREFFHDDLYTGWQDRAEIHRQAVEFIREGINRIGFTASDYDGLQKGRTVTLGGKEFQISGDAALSFYLHSKSEGNLHRILTAKGLQINSVDVPTVTDLMELQAIIDGLTDRERALGDLYNELNQKILAPALNKTSKELEGYELALDPWYYPIHRVFPKKVAGQTIDLAIEDHGRFQPRTGGTQTIRIEGFIRELLNGIQEDSWYAGMAIPMYNARSIMNDADWQKAARDSGQQEVVDALFVLMRRMQGLHTDQAIIDQVGQAFMNKLSQSVLSLRVSTLLVQYASIPAAMADINPKYLLNIGNDIGRVSWLKQYSPNLWERWEGGRVTREMGDIAAQNAAQQLFFARQPMLQKPLEAIAYMDRLAICRIAAMAEAELADTRPELAPGTPEYYTAAAARTWQIVRNTQGSWDMIDRSDLGSSDTLASRMATLFRTPMEGQFNILLRAQDEYAKSARTVADKERLAGKTSAVLMSAVAETAIKRTLKWAIRSGAVATLAALGLATWGDDHEDKDKKSTLRGISEDTAGNILGLVPFGNSASPVLRGIVAAANGESTYGTEPRDNALAALAVELAQISVGGVKTVRDAITQEPYAVGPNKDEPKWTHELSKLTAQTADVVSKMTGAPFTGPYAEWKRPATDFYNALKIQQMDTGELRTQLQKNTYARATEEHKPGDPHQGMETYVNMIETELRKR